MSDPMTHTDHLRSMAKDHLIAGNEHTADALLAGAEALEARGRVRNVLNGIIHQKAESEHARDHGHDNTEWHETTADTLEYFIDLLTEALEGNTK